MQRSGYAHPRCYARGDNNCSTKISKEHFISEVLLRRIELNDATKIAGLSWQRAERFDLIPTSGLASNILCERHNSILSGLDETIGLFVEAIKSIDRSPYPAEPLTFSGQDIERWMLKCVVGLAVSGNIRSTIKPECVEVLFERAEWPDGWGMYFRLNDRPLYHTDSLSIETRVGPNKLLLAANIFLQGLPFVLCLGKPDNPGAFGIWRPDQITFRSKSCESTINLSWKSLAHGSAVVLGRIGTYDGHPPNWKDWQRNG